MSSSDRSPSTGSGLTAVNNLETEADVETKHHNGTGAVIESHAAAGEDLDVEKALALNEKDEKDFSDDEDAEKDLYADVPSEKRGTNGLQLSWWCVRSACRSSHLSPGLTPSSSFISSATRSYIPFTPSRPPPPPPLSMDYAIRSPEMSAGFICECSPLPPPARRTLSAR